MAKAYRFEGIVTAVSPLAVCSKDLKDTVGKDAPTPIPTIQTELGERLMFTAMSLRGAIRRAARDLARNVEIKATGNEHPFTLTDHYMLTCGGNKGKGAQDRSTVALEAAWREKNPLLSLFGAGDAGVLGFVEGHLSMGNAIAREAVLAMHFSGARADEFYRNREQVDFLSQADIASLIGKSAGNSIKSKMEKEIKTLKSDFMKAKKAGDIAKMDVINGVLEARKVELSTVMEESDADDNSIGMPLKGWLAIPPGTEMSHTMTLRRSNEVELGFYLKSLEVFALTNPTVGAHIACGHGEISAKWKVYAVDINGKVELGEVSLTSYDTLTLSTDALKNAVKACDEYFAAQGWNFHVPTKLDEEVAEKAAA